MLAAPAPAVRDTFDILVELQGHPVPTFVGRAHAQPVDFNLVIVERHKVVGPSRAAVLALAQQLVGLQHPNLPAVREVLDTIGVVTIVFEYVEGEGLVSLDQVDSTRALGVGGRLRIILDVLSALTALHGLARAGTRGSSRGEPIARCVSPQSIVVGVDGRARLVHPCGGICSKETWARFVAPEVREKNKPDAASDLFGVGVLLGEALGAATFESGASLPNFEEAWMNELAACARRATSADREQRFSSAPALAAEIRRIAGTHIADPDRVAGWVLRHAGTRIASRRKDLAVMPPIAPISAEAPDSASRVLSGFPENEFPTRPTSMPPPVMDGARVDAPIAKAVVPQAPPVPLRIESWLAQGLSPPGSTTLVSVPSPSDSAVEVPVVSAPPSAVSIGPDVVSSRTPLLSRPPPRQGRVTALLAVSVAAFGAFWLWPDRPHKQATRGDTPFAAAGPVVATAVAPSSTVQSCPDGMALIPGGAFMMGSDTADANAHAGPAHRVAVASFCIDRTEVTTAQFKACSDRGECKRGHVTNDWLGITAADRQSYDPLCTLRDPTKFADYPINCIDWERADIFCKARGARLVTEAEWEFTSRGTEGRSYPWGVDAPSAKRLNACGKECTGWAEQQSLSFVAMHEEQDAWTTLAPVASFHDGATPEGVLDLAGNVAEWVSDWFAPYSAEAHTDPTGPSTGEARVVRGGSWNAGYASWTTGVYRARELPTKRSHALGFRCAAATR